MNTKLFLSMALTAGLISQSAWAVPVTVSTTSSVNQTIQDNNLNGLADTINLSGTGIQSISDVTVSLNIAGGFNGDFYAYLMHGSDISILLNRVGLDSSNPYGYSDSGFNVTLSDSAANGNIHTYQTVVNPNGGAITGTWQPDGRAVNPNNVSTDTPVTAGLGVFDGSDADGGWTLFIADASPGDYGDLIGWTLDVTGDNGIVVVNTPDTSSTLGLLAMGTGLLLLMSRRTRVAA